MGKEETKGELDKMKKDKVVELIIDDWINGNELPESARNYYKGILDDGEVLMKKEVLNHIKILIDVNGYFVSDRDIKELKERIKDWKREKKVLYDCYKHPKVKKKKVKEFNLNVNPCSPFGK